jgi:hypothetical protein
MVVAFFQRYFRDKINLAPLADVEPAQVDLDGQIGVGGDRAIFRENEATLESLLDILCQHAREHLVERGRPPIGIDDTQPVIDYPSYDLGSVEIARKAGTPQLERANGCRMRCPILG